MDTTELLIPLTLHQSLFYFQPYPSQLMAIPIAQSVHFRAILYFSLLHIQSISKYHWLHLQNLTTNQDWATIAFYLEYSSSPLLDHPAFTLSLSVYSQHRSWSNSIKTWVRYVTLLVKSFKRLSISELKPKSFQWPTIPYTVWAHIAPLSSIFSLPLAYTTPSTLILMLLKYKRNTPVRLSPAFCPFLCLSWTPLRYLSS